MGKIEALVYAYRKAIELALRNRRFDFRDRFSSFPIGCCDDACDLLGRYLLENDINSMQYQGTFRDGTPSHTTSHAWLQLEGDLIIDIIGDQFKYEQLFQFEESVYIGRANKFYDLFEIDRIIHNCNIETNPRLTKLYKIIKEYIP